MIRKRFYQIKPTMHSHIVIQNGKNLCKDLCSTLEIIRRIPCDIL